MQAATVMLPRHALRRGRIGWLGLLAPAAALGLGILLLRLLTGGPHALALVGAVATPVLAAARPRRAPFALVLWLVAWLAHGLVAQAAAVALIMLAAATVAEVAAAVAPSWSLAAGLVVLCVVDVILVWATPQVGPATTALHQAPLPSAAGHPIPRLGDATFGSATMGWLDFAAAALLGVVVARRVRAAVATGLAAGAWGLLLIVTSVVPATVPTLVGLVASRIR
ncbi:MAG TPA: hypothetical protein VGH82_12280 [Gaiellaceae bacterium]|jgi:hypothetical protein